MSPRLKSVETGSVEHGGESLADLADQINAAHAAVEGASRTSIEQAIEAGRLLMEAKKICGHGRWSHWLKKNFSGSERTAQKYIRLFDNQSGLRAKSDLGADLGIAEALSLLAEPGDDGCAGDPPEDEKDDDDKSENDKPEAPEFHVLIAVGRLQKKINGVLADWPKDCLPAAAEMLRDMADEIERSCR